MRIALLLLLVTANTTFAANKNSLDGCDDAISKLPKRAHIVGSGRNLDEAPKYKEVFELLFERGGTLDKLGINLGDEVVGVVVQGPELDALAGFARPPIGHWTDGRDILRTLNGSGLIYEFVAPGCGVQHSYYRDTLDFRQQVSIMLHVAGHYHFNRNSKFPQVRQVDMPIEGAALYDMLEAYYRLHDHDEVSGWYQKLMSLAWAQDMSRGSFDPVEMFKDQKLGRPTASVLQAFVANLPVTLPKWKKEMALLFEKTHRYYSGAVPTKIMNEGWASLMQELLAQHTPNSTFPDAMEFSRLMEGVARPSLNNPYWLGREAWRRVRARFNAAAENKGLTPLERDAKFIRYATENFIRKHDDYSFLQEALDAQWVRDNRLALTRRLTPEEENEIWRNGREIPEPTEDLQFPELRTTVTDDPKRVLRGIARQVADHRGSMPRVVVKSFNDKGKGIIALGFEDEYGKALPLERTSMVQTLYVYAQIMERPVSLETLAFSSWPGYLDEKEPWDPDFKGPQTTPIRVTVFPDGKVETPKEELSKELEKVVQAFALDTAMSEHEELALSNLDRWKEVKAEAVASVGASPPSGLYSHAPTAPRAIMEFQQLIDKRLLPSLLEAMKENGRLIRGANGVRIRALPIIPSFNYDRRAMQALLDSIEPEPFNIGDFVASFSKAGKARSLSTLPPEDGLDIGQGTGNPGDPYWGEGRPPDQGSGDGDGEPGDGEAGEGGQDPSFVDIPFDMYARLLGTTVELPRLRPKKGQIAHREEELDGVTQRRTGTAVNSEILRKMLKLGLAKSKGRIGNPRDMLFKGAAALQTHHWRVQDTELVKSPDFNAHVTFAVDMSGSMHGDPLLVAKKMAFDLRALLLLKYKQVKFSFVAFDGNGHVFGSIEEFIRANLGGGTDYKAGLKTAIEEQANYPRRKWDRYFVGLGDLEDFAPSPDEVMGLLKEITENSEYASMVGIGDGATGTPLGTALKSYAGTEEWFGYADVADSQTYTPNVFRKLFKNPD